MTTRHVTAVRGRGAMGLGRGLSAIIGVPPVPPPAPGGGWDGTQSPTGRNPIFIANSARQDVWALMKANYDANPSAPTHLGGQWYKGIKSAAELGSSYTYSLGQWATYMYQMTGDQAWCDLAWAQISGWWLTLPLGLDPNIHRVWAGEHTIMYDWLYPGLTPAQRTTFYNSLVANNQWYFDNYGPWSSLMTGGDSDQIAGHYLALALLYLLDPTNSQVAAMWNSAYTGGFTPTAENHGSTGRNALKFFAHTMAIDGEWCESSAYNLDTSEFMLPMLEAIRTATGVDYFPEFTALYPKLALSFMAHWTPDLASPFPWGDEEHAYQPKLYAYAQVLAQLAGLLQGTTEGEQVQQFIADMVTKWGSTFNNQSTFFPNVFGRWNYFYNPFAPAQTWKTTANLTRYAAGKGMLLQKSGYTSADSLFCVDSGQRLEDATTGGWWCDHFVEYIGHCELYGNGEWLLRSPFAYDGLNIRGAGRNCPLMHGCNGCDEFRRVVQEAHDATYSSICLTMGGSMQDKLYEAPNDLIAVHEWTRDLVHIPGLTNVVICFDRANVVAITDITKYTLGGSPYYRAPRERIIGGTFYSIFQVTAPPHRKQIIWHMPVSPTIAGQDVSWTTPLGKTVKLTQLLPATTTKLIRNEAALRTATEYDFNGAVDTALAPLAYHVCLHPTTTQQWDTFLGVIYAAGTAGVLVTKTDGTSQGVHGTRPGQDDFLAIFNGAQGITLNTTAHHSSHAADLAVTRLRATGFTHSWTAVGSNTIVILNHLDPAHSWTKNLDGGGAVTLAVDSQGHAKFVVAGSGAHTLVVA